MSFDIEITSWTNHPRLPICKITSSVEIKNAGFDFDAYSRESIDVHVLPGKYVTSFIFYSEARVHTMIGDIHLHMINLDDKVGIFLYSRTTGFTVGNDTAINKSGVWHCFAALEDAQKIQVKVGDEL